MSALYVLVHIARGNIGFLNSRVTPLTIVMLSLCIQGSSIGSVVSGTIFVEGHFWTDFVFVMIYLLCR